MTERFLWGAATSAHQVEGNNVHSDWWAWEKQTPGIERSGLACDHYQRFRDDFILARSLGHNAHRLSLEWSRWQYTRSEWSSKAIAHYREVLQELKKQQLHSFVTLHHFTNPQWFAEIGGWANPRAPHLFEQYVKRVVAEVGDLIDVWVTINEPMVYVLQSYVQGLWPPQQKNIRVALRVIRHVAAAHQLAYQAIHQRFPRAVVGIAQNFEAFTVAPDASALDHRVRDTIDWFYNHRFFSMTRGTHDYIGVNYYFTTQIKAKRSWPFFTKVPLSLPTSDLGWPISPAGLRQVLRGAKRYHLPIYITENGIANASDDHRSAFIRAHVRAVEQAQSEGIDVRGYLHWSLLDNFEWASGYNAKFGLVAVDLATQERTVRPSARVFQAIIEQSRRAG
ncbi:MAG: glycoside hydrolase family 1 protein [Candidatus Andersenbacteria bacterium]